MEEESKISFWKKLKISIFGLEEYQKLATQKISKTIGYLATLILIFAFFLSLVLTIRFGNTVNSVKSFIENEIETVNFEERILTIKGKSQDAIIIQNQDNFNGKIIIDTKELPQGQVSDYTEEIKEYQNGVLILRDKIILSVNGISTEINLSEVSDKLNLVKLDKQELLNLLSGTNIWKFYAVFGISMLIYLFIVYFASGLLDAVLYSIIGHITGMFSRLRLKYSATYSIAVHSLTLPIILNLIYIIVNILTGYTIKYFSIMYVAIASIYIITAILLIKSDIIKKQIELSKIIAEQEKVRQEMERQELERKEQEEKERVRKKDEEEKQKEKNRAKKRNNGETDKKEDNSQNQGPEPQANIKPM